MINLIRNIYYNLWADAINYERLKNGGENHWKIFTFTYMSILFSLNITALLSSILFFTGYEITSQYRNQLEVYFSSEVLANVFWSLTVLHIPSVIITYFGVFYKKKYEYILSNYKFKNGKWLLIYYLLTVLAFFGFSLLNKFFRN